MNARQIIESARSFRVMTYTAGLGHSWDKAGEIEVALEGRASGAKLVFQVPEGRSRTVYAVSSVLATVKDKRVHGQVCIGIERPCLYVKIADLLAGLSEVGINSLKDLPEETGLI